MVTTKKTTAAKAATGATGTKAARPAAVRSTKLVPASPESTGNTAKKRKRLAKAFPRPLDKKLRKQLVVREKFSIPALEYEQLLEVRTRLAGLGMTVKKSEIVRAGLVQLAALDDEALKALLERLPAAI